MFSLLLLTLNAPLQMGKCTPRGTCAPGWDLWYNLMSLFCFSYHQVRSQLREIFIQQMRPRSPMTADLRTPAQSSRDKHALESCTMRKQTSRGLTGGGPWQVKCKIGPL